MALVLVNLVLTLVIDNVSFAVLNVNRALNRVCRRLLSVPVKRQTLKLIAVSRNIAVMLLSVTRLREPINIDESVSVIRGVLPSVIPNSPISLMMLTMPLRVNRAQSRQLRTCMVAARSWLRPTLLARLRAPSITSSVRMAHVVPTERIVSKPAGLIMFGTDGSIDNARKALARKDPTWPRT